MNTCHQFSKFMMNIWRIWAPEGRAAEWQAIKLQINKMASMAIIMIEGTSINATAFVGGSYSARQVETKIVLKKRKGGMISQWRSTKWPTKSIKKIEQSSTVGLQLMPESRSRQNRILLIRIMLWSWTTRCIIKILIWGNHYCLTSTSQVLHKNKVKWSTSEKWLWLWDWLPVISCEHKRNWKENFQESAMALKPFGKDCLLWRSWLKKLECYRTLQSFGWWSKPSGRFNCLPWSISLDQLLMLNLQMKFITLMKAPER